MYCVKLNKCLVAVLTFYVTLIVLVVVSADNAPSCKYLENSNTYKWTDSIPVVNFSVVLHQPTFQIEYQAIFTDTTQQVNQFKFLYHKKNVDIRRHLPENKTYKMRVKSKDLCDCEDCTSLNFYIKFKPNNKDATIKCNGKWNDALLQKEYSGYSKLKCTKSKENSGTLSIGDGASVNCTNYFLLNDVDVMKIGTNDNKKQILLPCSNKKQTTIATVSSMGPEITNQWMDTKTEATFNKSIDENAIRKTIIGQKTSSLLSIPLLSAIIIASIVIPIVITSIVVYIYKRKRFRSRKYVWDEKKVYSEVFYNYMKPGYVDENNSYFDVLVI